MLRNTSEAEATARVLLFVLHTIDVLEGVTVHMEPSVDNHSNFMIVEDGSYPLSFIEVKKGSTFTDLGIQDSATAQALREAHILLNKMPPATNSIVWSFGVAQKAGNKIKLLHYFNLYVPSFTKLAGVQQLLHALKLHFRR